MWKQINIAKIFKLLSIAVVAMFMLTSCGGDENDTKRAAMQGNEISAANEQATCWQNFIIDTLYDNMGKVALGTYSKITNGALVFMMVAFAVWLSLRLLKHVGSFTEENLGEVWTEISRKLFLCLFCGYLASSTDGLLYFMDMIVFPVYNAFLEFSSALLAQASVTSTNYQDLSVFGFKFSSGEPIICKASSVVKSTSLDGFPSAPKEMMNCMVCAMNDRMNLGLAMAYKVLKAPGFMATIVGLMIIACFTFVKLGFVFYLVDSIFRFTVMVVMLPILIMGYPFKLTHSWLKQGFLTMINSAGFMMFISFMIAITLLALEQVIIDNRNIFIDGNDEQSFKEFSVPFMCLLMIGFLIVSSIDLAKQVTDSLVGGNSEGSFNAKAKSTIVGGAKLTGMVAGWLGMKFLTHTSMGKKALEKYQAGKSKVENFRAKMNNFRGG